MGKITTKFTPVAAFALLMGAAGCVELPFGQASDVPVQVTRNVSADDDAAKGTKTVAVGGQTVVLGDAGGYCIKSDRSRYTSSGAFLVMAPCDPTAPGNTARGLVLVNVLASKALQDAVKAEQMESFFKSDSGKAALSAHGRSEDIEILGTMEEDGIFVVHARDATGAVIPDTSDEIWRTFLVVSERLVSVSVINFTDAPMVDGLIFAQLEAIAQRIQDLNK